MKYNKSFTQITLFNFYFMSKYNYITFILQMRKLNLKTSQQSDYGYKDTSEVEMDFEKGMGDKDREQYLFSHTQFNPFAPTKISCTSIKS